MVKQVLYTMMDFVTTFITAIIAFIAIALVIISILGWHVFSIDSSSMSPAYPVNTLVIVQSVDNEDIQEGEVITYTLNDDVLITHRVVSINEDGTLTTKGDANNTEDATHVSYENVVGKVILGIPYAGGLLRVITASENRIMVIGCIVVLFMFSFIWDMMVKKIKEGSKTIEK